MTSESDVLVTEQLIPIGSGREITTNTAYQKVSFLLENIELHGIRPLIYILLLTKENVICLIYTEITNNLSPSSILDIVAAISHSAYLGFLGLVLAILELVKCSYHC